MTKPSSDDPRFEAKAPAASRRPRGGAPLETRALVLGWCLWLLGSWAVLWAVAGWSTPALRSMVFLAMVGLMGVWPAVRLSQMTRRYPALGRGGLPEDGDVTGQEWAAACRGVLMDWVCLNLVFQAVLWPLQLAARWTLVQTLWLDAAVAGWSLLTGLLIAWGRGTDRGGLRWWAMVVCVGVVVVEPALWWVGWPGGASGLPAMRMSPLAALWALSSPMSADLAASAARAQSVQVVSVIMAALVGWGVLWGLLGWSSKRER